MNNLNHLDYYRLPWNLTDNSISWLEPTAKCNLYCEGCYRLNEKDGHKPLEQVKEELDVFQKFRKSDGVSIAGGDPLTHPDIIEIVREVKKRGMKPILNTNGLALTKDMLIELKKAGAFGFTFHIDSKQGRPGWKDKNELELNDLRMKYADMLHEVGNLSCSFNSTVYEDTMKYIPGMVKWAEKHINKVHVMVFILYRAVENEQVDFYLGPKKIDMSNLVYNEDPATRSDIKAPEIVEILRKEYPDLDPCAYLNGSEKPDSFKWLLTGRLGRKNKIYGYVGRKGMEAVQMFNHLFRDKYLAYARPRDNRKGRLMLLMGIFDKKLRKAFFNYYKNPLNIFRRLHYQSIMIIQPVDFVYNGQQNMCDGCPDMTVWNGQLVWSCRMEEQLTFGTNLKTYPKNAYN